MNNLTAGVHSLTATYARDEKFGGSAAAITITVANLDFTLGATPPNATLGAGRSAQFMLTVTPAGGFTSRVTFSCPPIVGITCNFNPATVTTANGAASTVLTVTTAANVSHCGILLFNLIGGSTLLGGIGALGLLLRREKRMQSPRTFFVPAMAVLALMAVTLAVGGCGGYFSPPQTNRGTASIVVKAQSGNISHSTNITVTVQ